MYQISKSFFLLPINELPIRNDVKIKSSTFDTPNTPVRQVELDSFGHSPLRNNLNSSPATVTSQNGSVTRRRLIFRRQAELNENPEHLAQDPTSDPLRALLDEEDGISSNSGTIGSLRTPRHYRGDVHPNIRLPLYEDNENGNLDELPANESERLEEEQRKVKERQDQIWGTNVEIKEVKKSFEGFLLNFKLQYRKEKESMTVTDIDREPFYQYYMQKIKQTEIYKLNLDMQNLLAYEPAKKLYFQLMNYPQEVLPIFDDVLTATYKRHCVIEDPNNQIMLKVRPFNLGKSTNMRDLNPAGNYLNYYYTDLTSPILPEMSAAFFRCSICDSSVEVEVDRGKIDEPHRCRRRECNSTNTMTLIHNRSSFKDRQVCRLQETPDNIPDGQTPHSVSVCLYDDLVDAARPGDKVELTAIYRSTPIRLHPRKRTIKALFKTYLDVVHIARADMSHMNANLFDDLSNDLDAEDSSNRHEIRPEFTEEEMAYFESLPKQRDFDLYQHLAQSLAPSIYGLDDIKKGILLQLFGGTRKKFERSGSPHYRGDINVLLVGDPGTAKSQMLQYVHKIAPRGVYTSGKGSSAVGLTAYVTRDPDTKQMVLESGALVLSDEGVCCIDEFDKMSEGARAILHEVMEQQTISVAKAGIITTLNARTSVLASANPIDSKYNPKLSIVKNIDLPPTLMSRFDLIYLVLDKVSFAADRKLAKHLVSLYREDNPYVARRDILPIKTLAKYIKYARKHYHPFIGDDQSANALVNAYVDLRRVGIDPRSSENIITATTRQLESMIRLSEAHARMRLSQKVEISDVREAERLLREAIQLSAWDPETGRIDMDLITTGHGSHERRMLEAMRNAFVRMLSESNVRSISFKKALENFNAQSDEPIHERQIESILRNLERDGVIKVTGANRNDRMITRI
ncbi:MCM-domain-containing protein [Gigaspora margarita]|uniref:DNA replication licensing factor MCM4 n=1 Tax=Gigaspora margarita TaxID=4874 RepID=A0A8H4EPT3_GIGMA|nr:MCM-domain-containing protein [Gigaspora margarita]